MSYPCVSYSGGVQVQGRMWRDGLSKLGHEVILMNNWDKYDYSTFDYVIFLGIGYSFGDLMGGYTGFANLKIVSAPIIDFPGSVRNFKFRCRYFGSRRLKIRKPLHDMYLYRNKVCFFLARSEHEKKYIVEGFGVSEEKVKIVPLHMRLKNIKPVDLTIKESYCLHMSRLADPGKNVHNLVLAAKKYGFQLKLGGTLNSEGRKWLANEIGDAKNIEYLGWLTEQELEEVYRKAKVFALPSFVEGVGMVALEAAVNGCEIVLTDIGAPKEYWNGKAVLVNPYDVDSIGTGVLEAMNKKKEQPKLSKYILDTYSEENCMEKLQEVLFKYNH